MNFRILLTIGSIIVALASLVYIGATASAKEVVTVDRILRSNDSMMNVRLGARVADQPIEYQTTPRFELRFFVHDIKQADKKAPDRSIDSANMDESRAPVLASIPVTYNGIMPDTLKVGRDVILEGHYKDGQFIASTLLTQCPSKYEVPDPGAHQKGSAGAGY